MTFNFTECLALILVALLFAKDTLLPAIMKKLGLSNGNGNGSGEYQRQIDALERHAQTSNDEVGKIQVDIAGVKHDISEIKDNVSELKENVAFIRGSLSGHT